MQFNTISAQPIDLGDYYKQIEEHYLNRPAYRLLQKGNYGPELGKYKVKGLSRGISLLDGFYLNKDLDPITGMIKQKSALASHSLYSVLKQIDIRKDMLRNHLDQIDYAICRADTYLFELEPWPRGISPIADKRRGALENLVQSLEQEKRREDITAFGDLRLLNQDLNEAIVGYLSANRASNILEDTSLQM